ncbi:MAG: ferritin-like domain-containing protein [Rhodovibrionaceae bacterium]|nr:ferritin-like domain-containing protein [Rhodovibrionaceae bacterium]
MAEGSAQFHEDPKDLKQKTIERHRAVVSLMEELEAVDWYDQRVDASKDEELRVILAHNRDEEMEHAAMVLEWLRRNSSVMDEQLREYLFKDGPIIDSNHGGGHDHDGAEQNDGSLNIGSLRED